MSAPITATPVAQPGQAAPAAAAAVPGILSGSAHPWVLIFHLGMKAGAVFCYMVLFWLLDWFVMAFICTTVCLAVDFWFTKNVSGRLLAGMRWWSFVKDDGSSEWMFESMTKEQLNQLNQMDVNLFWKSLYIFGAFWLISAAFNLLTLDANNFVLCVIGATFATSNVLGYRKCAKAKTEISALTAVKLLAAAKF